MPASTESRLAFLNGRLQGFTNRRNQLETEISTGRVVENGQTIILTPTQIRWAQEELAKVQSNIAAVEATIAKVQAEAAQPPASSADTTAQAQTARDDSANTSATTVTQKETGPDGRVVEKAANAPTNADPPKTTANGNVDAGTNAETVTLTTSQGIPGGYGSGANNPSLVPAPTPTAAVATERGFAQTAAANTGGTPGVGAQREDAAKPPAPANSVVNRLDELYAGAKNAIISQDNVLDQFGSYTYSLSWYLVDHKTYNTLITSDIKQLNSYYLLAQSGGAPIQTTSQSYVPVTSAGRSPFFTLDYYLDNFVIDSSISSTAGSGGAAKLTSLSFTVTEPNGITLQPNLIRAINDLYQKGGLAPPGTMVNYFQAHFVMVVKFYGYDSKGNLVIPIDQRQGVTDRQAAIEKFIPFQLTDIQFKVANKLVEYSITGVPVEQNTAFSTDRGSIPQAFQFQGTTVKDILVGALFDATNNQSDSENNRLNRRSPPTGNSDNESAAERARLGIKSAPAKAPDAPKKVSGLQGTGLCAALNAFYAEQAKARKGIPDIYEVQFLDKMLANAKVTPPGAVDKAFAGGNPNANAATNLDPNRQNFNPSIRIRSVTQGQQIVQFMDEVMRSSSYISDQQKAVWQIDPKTGKYDWMYNGKTAENFAWFNITCEAQAIGYDTTTNSTAYKMIYKIAPYQTSMIATSEYFNPSSFRGVHKVYNYWFTGQNTQVLQYEQSFNGLWKQTISRNSPGQKASADVGEFIKNQVNSRVMYSKRFMPASNQTREGAEGDVYEAAANAADMLYTTDLTNITLQVIGDPAWIPSPKNPQPGTFVVSPFFPDGTINLNAGVPYFEFAWNRPVDYNLSTGLMDPGQNNYFADRAHGRAGLAQEAVVYLTTNVKSTFAKGKFTQDLVGAMLQDGKNISVNASKPASETTRVADSANEGNAGEAQAIAQAGVQKTSEAQNLANQYSQYRSVPTAESSGDVITGNTLAEPLPATPPVQTTEVAPAPPPKLGAGGFGSGANNPSLAGISAAPQLLSKEA